MILQSSQTHCDILSINDINLKGNNYLKVFKTFGI